MLSLFLLGSSSSLGWSSTNIFRFIPKHNRLCFRVVSFFYMIYLFHIYYLQIESVPKKKRICRSRIKLLLDLLDPQTNRAWSQAYYLCSINYTINYLSKSIAKFCYHKYPNGILYINFSNISKLNTRYNGIFFLEFYVFFPSEDYIGT